MNHESLATAAEWIGLERRCCPFFRFVLEVPAGEPVCHLTVDGEEGVRDAVELELPPFFR